MGRSQAQLQLWEDVRTDSAYEEDLLGLSTEVAGGSQRQDPLSSCVTWGHPAPRLSCSQVSLSANYDNHASLRSGRRRLQDSPYRRGDAMRINGRQRS